MVVGDDVSVGADNHAGAETGLLLFGLFTRLLLLTAALLRAEEEFEQRVVVHSIAAILLLASRLGSGEAFYRDDSVDGLLGGTHEIVLRYEACVAFGRALRRLR